MRRLLEIELGKLLPSRDVRVSLTVYALLLALALLSLKAFTLETAGATARVDLLAFPDVWQNAAYLGGWIAYLLYVILLQAVTHEYQFRTNRQNVIDGMTRASYVGGKLLLVVVLTLGSTLLVAALAAGFGGWTGGGLKRGAGIAFVPLYGLQALGYLALALLIGTIVRRTGAAVLAFIGYTLLAEPLLRALVLPARVGRYLPSASFAALVPNPFFGYAGMRVTGPGPQTIAVCAVDACLLAAAAAWVFSKQDL